MPFSCFRVLVCLSVSTLFSSSSVVTTFFSMFSLPLLWTTSLIQSLLRKNQLRLLMDLFPSNLLMLVKQIQWWLTKLLKRLLETPRLNCMRMTILRSMKSVLEMAATMKMVTCLMRLSTTKEISPTKLTGRVLLIRTNPSQCPNKILYFSSATPTGSVNTIILMKSHVLVLFQFS